jgi:hypothetical protein
LHAGPWRPPRTRSGRVGARRSHAPSRVNAEGGSSRSRNRVRPRRSPLATRQCEHVRRACRVPDPRRPAKPRCRSRGRPEPSTGVRAAAKAGPRMRSRTSNSPLSPSAKVSLNTPWLTTATAVMSGVSPIIEAARSL